MNRGRTYFVASSWRLPELIAQAKKEPGSISYAVTGVGRLTHLTGELLQIRANIQLQMVPN
jgi:tripartite-type tricarboxylate transporter receptor subunit TctC